MQIIYIIALLVIFPGLAVAQNISIDGSDISIDTGDIGVDIDNGDVNISNQGSGGSQDISVDANGDVMIKNDGAGESQDIRVGPGGDVSVRTDGEVDALLDVDLSGNTQVNLATNSGNVSISGADGSLSVQVQNGKIPNSATKAVVNLENNSVLLINDDTDLATFGNMVVAQYSSVSKVEVRYGDISVSYKEPAKLLGLFSADINSDVHVSSDGSVKVKFPWFSFLYSGKDKKERQSEVSLAINDNGSNLSANVSSDSTQVRVRSSAKIVSVVAGAISASVTY